MRPGFGDLRPKEHSGPWAFDFPAQPRQAVAQRVAADLVLGSQAFDRGVAMTHGNDGGDLDRLKDAVIVIPFDRGQGPDHFRVA